MQLTILNIYVGIVFMAFEMEVVAFLDAETALHCITTGVWSFWKMRPMLLSLCPSLPPTTTFSTY